MEDEEGVPIVGATVHIKGTINGTITSLDGKYELETDQNEGLLVVSFVGYETAETNFGLSNEFLVITLKTSNNNLGEVIAIGYGTAKRKDLTGAVAMVENMEQINSRAVTTFNDFLQGSVAGVTVVQQGGDPTNEASIIIRGVGSFNNEKPLYVVDGMPYYGGTINPNDIESVTILKDAASAAIYGAQASSGVIVITTKSGKAGKPVITIDAFAGIQQAMNLPTPLTAEEQNWAYNTAADNSGATRNPARNPELNPWGNTTRTNWIDEIFRNAAIYNTNVSLSGGNDKGRYSASFNYQDKEGLLIGTSAKRIGVRLKSEYNLTEKLLIGENFYAVNQEAIGTNTSSPYSGTIINAVYMPSAASVYDEEGNFHGVAPEGSVYAGAYGDVYNPVALLLRPTTKNPITNIDGNIYGEYAILKGLKFRSSFSLSQRNYEYKKFTPKIPENGRPSEMNYLTQSWSKTNKWVWDNQITYSKALGNHQLEVTGVSSAQFTRYEYNNVNAQDFAREEEWYQFLGNAGEIPSYGGDSYEDALYSIIGRLRYSFMDKYFITGSIRRDQTSRLAKSNNSDVFPSASLAWVISNEPFLKNSNWLDNLKLRAS
ncbi:MAG: SusC/RagA family TonB-linked outer membrane protein, partial [Chloroflexia bacterium]|nr:SusC/RagA family TonB-linked outer membrane protein [Chloroflexia bacterium]